MAPLPHCFKNFFLFYTLFLSSLFASSFFVLTTSSQIHQQKSHNFFLARRNLLEKSLLENENQDEDAPKKKKSLNISSKNQTKLIKPTSSSSKNQTKLIKPTSNSTPNSKKNQTKLSPPTKENVGAKPKVTKNLNSTKKSSSSSSLDPKKNLSSTNSTTKVGSREGEMYPTQSASSKEITKTPSSNTKNKQQKTQTQTQKTKSPPSWMMYQDDDHDDDDLISEFRDLPINFHKTFIPDLQKISTTSQIYFTKANKEITKTYIKPYVGKKYASAVTTAVSFAFMIVPFLLVSLIFNRIKAYFSLQKLLIFIQIYLSIYFSTLCLSSLITGLEPLKFFYSTSQSTYVWLQVLQTLGYVMYLLMLLMYLVLVFSTETGLGQKFLGLGQTFVGFAVGLHYYMTVFHRVVLRQPPKTNWKVHGVYATCFLVICLFAHAERRKKVYFEEGGEEGKQS